MSNDLISKISESLSKSGSDTTCRSWAKYIVENKIPISELTELIHSEYPVAIRFSWVLGGICEMAPAHVFPAITYFFNHRVDIDIPNFNRSLAKMFALAGIPEEIESEAIDELFKWLADKKSNVSTKSFAMLALQRVVAKYPEFKNELEVAIEEQLYRNSEAFRKRAKEVLESL